MAHVVRIHETGGTDVLRWEEVQVGKPAAGQVRLRQTAVGLNFIDTYHRTGLYPLELPAVLGMEAAGVVEAIGDDAGGFSVGDRVAYPLQTGAYAEERLIGADRLVQLPDEIDDPHAAALMLKGMTAWYLLRRTYVVQPGDTVLIHAAAGGVGSIACQWASDLGATVIGTVGSDEKATLARANGCHHPVLYKEESFVDRVREITDGRGVPVVYDSVGRDTFDDSLDCLRPLGMMVSFGQSSGPRDPLPLGILAQKGSLFLTRPTLGNYIATRRELEAAAKELFDLVRRGALSVDVGQSYPLRDAARAHTDLETRRTSGSTVLLP